MLTHMQKSFFFLIACFILCQPSFADGLVRNGHVAGEHIDLKLTEAQSEFLKKQKDGATIQITTVQRAVLVQSAPRARIIKELSVFPSNYVGCTCELVNVAVLVAPDKIEVSKSLLGRSNTDFYWHYNGQRSFESDHTKPNSPEILLLLSGQTLYWKNQLPAATTTIKAALKINPNFTPAKYWLGYCFDEMAKECASKGKFREAISNYKQALAVQDRSDLMSEDRRNEQIKELQNKIGKNQ